MSFPIPGLPQPGTQPSVKHFWHSEITTASPEAIWQIWADVDNWATWDTNIEHASLAGALKIDATGVITIDGRATVFTVDGIANGRFYRLEIERPISNLFIQRSMEETSEGLRITHEVWFEGLASWLAASRSGARMRQQLPKVVRKVKRLAEK